MNLRWFALIALSASFAAPAISQVSTSRASDIVLVVDNSISMRAADHGRTLPQALRAFVRGLPPDSRVAVVLFGAGADLVRDLAADGSHGLDAGPNDPLNRLRYDARRSNLPAGLERAIYELRENARGGAGRVIVFVTDGLLDVGGAATEDKARWLREGLTAEAKQAGVRMFVLVIGRKADFQFAQTLALATDGAYFRVPGAADLPAILSKVLTRLTQPADELAKKPEAPAPRSSPVWLWPVLVGACVVTILVVSLVAMARRRSNISRIEEPERAAAEATSDVGSVPSLRQLREQNGELSQDVASASKTLQSAEARLKALQAAVELHAVAAHRTTQDAEARCITLARECILTLDHMDLMAQDSTQSKETTNAIGGVRKRVRRILEDASIEEIPVQCGEMLDSLTQVPVSFADNDGPDGVVVKVERKGYMMKLASRGDLILRPAEVVVSRRPAVNAGAGGTPR